MNTKHQLIRIITKTMKASIISKNQSIDKSRQITPNKKLKKVQTRIKNIKIQQINYNYLKKEFGQSHFSQKVQNKDFQPPDLQIDFLIDSGAESKNINIPTWIKIQTSKPKFSPLKHQAKYLQHKDQV